MTGLERWTRGSFSHDGVVHDTYRQEPPGGGPGVVVIHEIPEVKDPLHGGS